MFELKPALFLDLDGTIRYSKNGEFINKPEDIVLFPDVEEKLWEYKKMGFLIFGISNQGGVAFGHKTQQDCNKEIEVTTDLFKENPFDSIKMCVHHPNGSVEPFNHRSLLRKPNIGMLVLCEGEAFEEGFIIDWDKSLFVGDRPEDLECANRAAIDFQWAYTFFGREVDETNSVSPGK